MRIYLNVSEKESVEIYNNLNWSGILIDGRERSPYLFEIMRVHLNTVRAHESLEEPQRERTVCILSLENYNTTDNALCDEDTLSIKIISSSQ